MADSNSPNLGVGAVAGRITGADQRTAYVYILGRPDLVSSVAADGSFMVRDVPIGEQKVVLFDGRDRSELTNVTVSSATITRDPSNLERDASRMSRAGHILAATKPACACLGKNASFEVLGALLLGADGKPSVRLDSAVAADVFPLPAGSFTLRVAMSGFRTSTVVIDVIPGASTPIETPLEVDLDDGEHKGCNSTGCAPGLECRHDDGQCTPCRSGSPGCSVTSLCSACASDSDCGPGASCILAGSGSCLPSCASGDCPAGYACQVTGAAGPVCAPVATCEALLSTFGAVCFEDSAGTGLADGRCFKEEADDLAGHCTARCRRDADCPAALPRCDSGGGVCVR